MQAGSKAVRQSNMELLRILAAAGVIILHFNARALPAAGGMTRWALLLLELVSGCAVNVYVMLCGYFLYKRERVSVYKPLSLLLQLLVYRLTMHLIELAVGSSEFTWKGLLLLVVPTDYFLILYAALYLLSPIINRVVALQDDRKLRRFLLLLFLLFSVWNYALNLLETLTGLRFASASTVGAAGAQEGYTIVNFALCYCIGAAIGRKSIRIRRPEWLFLLCLAAELVISRRNVYLSVAYHSPFLICQAACALLMAEKVKLHSGVINFFARSTLSVYMVHMHLLARFDPASCAWRSLPESMAYLALAVVSIYAVGAAAHCLYEAAARPIRRRLTARVHFPEISL